jgi:hypothetical protein
MVVVVEIVVLIVVIVRSRFGFASTNEPGPPVKPVCDSCDLYGEAIQK